MNLQTKIDITPPDFTIDYTSKLLLLGSCFAENMGEKFAHYKFDVDINPCGIAYNPFSVANTLDFIIDNKQFGPEELLYVDDKWTSLFHHGSFSDQDQTTCLTKINTRLAKASANFTKNDLLIITWGTAWVYRHVERDTIVTNCHKIPTKAFDRKRLTVSQIVERYASLIRRLQDTNPKLRILFTVSPIRHWKDGAHGNQLSKSILLLAIEQLQAHFKSIYYFPAYEIVLDELRDYRFYREDMLHLSTLTVDYIWERLLSSHISPQILDVMNRISRIKQGIAHRPFDEHAPKYQEMVEKLLTEIDDVTASYPSINFNVERSQLKALFKEQ